jgi:hypothetical protein
MENIFSRLNSEFNDGIKMILKQNETELLEEILNHARSNNPICIKSKNTRNKIEEELFKDKPQHLKWDYLMAISKIEYEYSLTALLVGIKIGVAF